MGNNSSSQNILKSLPQNYILSNLPYVYQLKDKRTNPNLNQNNLNKNLKNEQQQQINQYEQTQTNYPNNLNNNHENQFPYLKNYVVLLNYKQMKQYLTHLQYRNQKSLYDYIVQIPFGKIQKDKQKGYCKLNLYIQQIILNLNQLSQLNFYDMIKIIYIALVGFKYLYVFFGLFKIQSNMIGFTRQGRVKVWLNNKLAKDKPLPLVTDVNLKRFKEQQSYMVDDLISIFNNKVDKLTIPNGFNIYNNTNIRASRLTSSRLASSRVSSEKNFNLTQSRLSSLENNLIDDFSDGGFNKFMDYIQDFFNIERPEIKLDLKNFLPQKNAQISKIIEQSNNKNNFNSYKFNQKKHKLINYFPLIVTLINSKHEILSDKNSKINFSLKNHQHYVRSLQKIVKFRYGSSKQKSSSSKVKFVNNNQTNSNNKISFSYKQPFLNNNINAGLSNKINIENNFKQPNKVTFNNNKILNCEDLIIHTNSRIKAQYIRNNEVLPTLEQQSHQSTLIQSFVKDISHIQDLDTKFSFRNPQIYYSSLN